MRRRCTNMIHIIKRKIRKLYHKYKYFGLFYQKLSRLKVDLLSKMSDESYVKIKYKTSTGEKLRLNNPRSFNEKLQWLKLYYHVPLYTQLVDKYSVREYVKEKIGEEYLTKCYGIYSRFEDIEFDKLPDKFVIKCTHDCGSVVLCDSKSKLDMRKIGRKLNTSLSHNYYYQSREWPYKNVIPRIIVEEYLEDRLTKDLNDYKFYCFNGVPKVFFISSGRKAGDLRLNYYDMKFHKLPFECDYPNFERKIEKPKNFEKMIELAAKLSIGIPFVRVDFYNIEGRIVFGEMTFFDSGGAAVFKPKKWNYILGKWIDLPAHKVL